MPLQASLHRRRCCCCGGRALACCKPAISYGQKQTHSINHAQQAATMQQLARRNPRCHRRCCCCRGALAVALTTHCSNTAIQCSCCCCGGWLTQAAASGITLPVDHPCTTGRHCRAACVTHPLKPTAHNPGPAAARTSAPSGSVWSASLCCLWPP